MEPTCRRDRRDEPAVAGTDCIGAALIAFGNQMRNQMDETGKSITNWFTSARNAANTSAGSINSGSNPA